ncbi:NADPH-dependent FMN reductase [Patescibacteria group bacterium]
MSDLHLLVVHGTSRRGNKSIKAAEFVTQTAKKNKNLSVKLVTPHDFKTPGDGRNKEDKSKDYGVLVKKADGFIFVIPEYNHAFPGSIKRLLDTEFDSYNRKPVLLVGVSSGPWGGVRAIQSILPVVRSLKMIAIKDDIYFTNINEFFDGNGEPIDRSARERVQKSIKELLWFAKTLKKGRESQL